MCLSRLCSSEDLLSVLPCLSLLELRGDPSVNIAVCVSFCVASKKLMSTTFIQKFNHAMKTATDHLIICSLFSSFSLMLKMLSLVPSADVVSGRNHFKRGQTEVESLAVLSP